MHRRGWETDPVYFGFRTPCKSEKNEKKIFFSKDLDLLYKDRSTTAQATENSFNKEPKRLIRGLDLPLLIVSPIEVTADKRVPGLGKE